MITRRTPTMRAAAAVVIGFLIAGASATAASATPAKTNVVKATVVATTVTPQCVPHDAVAYQAAVPPTYETIPNPSYVPAVAEVSHTEFKYKMYVWDWRHNYQAQDDRVGNSDYGSWDYVDHSRTDWTADVYSTTPWKHYNAWYKWAQDDSKKVIDIPASPAIGQPTIQVMTDPGKPEVQAVPATYCEWYTWDPGTWAPGASNANDVGWPQALVGAGKLVPTACETTYQQDLYGGTREQIDAVVGDGVLAKLGPNLYEDSSIVKAWHFVSTAKCPPLVPVETQPTVTTTDVCGPDNATLAGNPQDGVVWSEVTKGDDGTLSITASPAKGYSFPEGFQTTFTMKDSGKACDVEITAVAASVVDPPVCGPNNDVLTIPTTEGVTYSDTGWVEGERTITATANEGYVLVGTTSWTFTDAATECPIGVTPVMASVIDPPVCGPDNDVLDIPTTEGVIYSDTGWVEGTRTITATAAEGYVLEGQTSWTFHDENTPCEAATVTPTVVPVCFPNNDTVTIPELEGVIYSDTGWVDGKRTITATAVEGYVLTGETSWTFTDVPSAGCAPVGPVFSGEDPTALAFTGVPGTTGGFVALATMFITAGTALVLRRRRAF